MFETLGGSGVVLQEGIVAGGFFFIFFLIFTLVPIAGMWKVFTKAGKPGWAAIVPVYNVIVLLQIVGRPVIWIVGFLIPVVNFIVAVLVSIDLAKSFGKGAGYGIGIVFVPFVFLPLLGFGGAQYYGPAQGTPQAGQQQGQYQQGQQGQYQGGHQQGGQGAHQQGGHQHGGQGHQEPNTDTSREDTYGN